MVQWEKSKVISPSLSDSHVHIPKKVASGAVGTCVQICSILLHYPFKFKSRRFRPCINLLGERACLVLVWIRQTERERGTTMYLCAGLMWAQPTTVLTLQSSVADPWHFGVDPDPDPRMHAWLVDPDPDTDLDPAIFVIDLQDASKKLIFLHNFFCLLLFEATLTSFFKDKKSNRVIK